jgi:hypothetical protein
MRESDDHPGRERTLESLEQLVAALDRRAPHTPGADGRHLAPALSGLREEAALRIDRLQRAAHTADVAQALSDEVMTDDGAPLGGDSRD